LSEGAEDKDNQASETRAPPDLDSDVSSSPIGPQQAGPRVNEDYDERAAEFWGVYAKEAQRYDETLIGTWKEDIGAIIIYVRDLPRTINLSLMCYLP